MIIWTFAFKPVSKMLERPQGRDRAGPQGRRAGPERPRERGSRSASPPSPRLAARRTRSWPAPRRSPRRRATRTSPRPARSSSACASAPPPRSRPRRPRAIASSAPRSPTSPCAPPSKVVGETMTDERQRRLVEEFLQTPSGVGGCEELMARRETAARRYAEAAFEVAMRDDAVEAWRSELDTAAAIVGRRARRPDARQPGPAARAAASTSPSRIFGTSVSQARPEPDRADAPARPDRGAAATRRRIPPARRRAARASPIATATSAAPLTQDEIRALTERLEAVDRRSHRTRGPGRSQPARRPGRASRRPPHRRQRPRPPRAAAEPARLGRPLGELTPMAIRSDEITSIIKSAIDDVRRRRRDPQRRHRRRGRRRHRPDLRARRRARVGAARVPGRA